MDREVHTPGGLASGGIAPRALSLVVDRDVHAPLGGLALRLARRVQPYLLVGAAYLFDDGFF